MKAVKKLLLSHLHLRPAQFLTKFRVLEWSLCYRSAMNAFYTELIWHLCAEEVQPWKDH